MSNKHSNIDIFGPASVTGSSFNIRKFLTKILFHWPLFLIFFGISFLIAIFYLKNERPIYEIHAKVFIKPNQSAQKSALQELNIVDEEKYQETEIGLMNSIPVIEQVVTDLQLWVTYEQHISYFSSRDIYTSTPVQFKLIKPGRNFSSDHLDILIKNKDYFLIKQSGDKFKQYSFKDTFVSNFGTWKLDTTGHLKDYVGKAITIYLDNPKEVIKDYQSMISFTVLPKSNDVELVVEDEVPTRGRAVLNDLLRVYMDASVQENRQSSENTLKFVDQRLVSITQELNNVESKYEGFRSNRGITEISNESSKYLSNVQSTDNQLNAVNIKLSVIDGIERYVGSDQGAENPPAILGMDDAGLSGLIKQYSDLQLQRTRLLATLPENNPLFDPINQQISSTRNALKENLKSIKTSLITTRDQLQSLGSGYESSIRNIPGQERELVDIKRMQGIKENLYVYLLQKKEELSLDYASTISDAVIIDHAHNGPQKWPVSKAVYAISLLFALIIPTGLLIGRDLVKNRILSKSEIISTTGLSVLSEIIFAENNNPIVVLNQSSYIGEQFRDLRTKLNYLLGKHEKGKITLFTSSISGEGKSFVLSNLGATLSVSGKKTILIELDLRRPTFSSRFKLDKTLPGVTDFLIGNATKNQIIQKLDITNNLFVIDCGTIPPNPSELLESEELAALLKDLRLEYDHILLDTPPVHLLTDAMIVAPLCDLSLYLVRQDYTPKKELEFISEIYQEKKLPRLNLIFNGIQSGKHGDRYNYEKNSYYTQYPRSFKSGVKRFFSRF
jgi:capsular exopolysaccharide synthesis family protein